MGCPECTHVCPLCTVRYLCDNCLRPEQHNCFGLKLKVIQETQAAKDAERDAQVAEQQRLQAAKDAQQKVELENMRKELERATTIQLQQAAAAAAAAAEARSQATQDSAAAQEGYARLVAELQAAKAEASQAATTAQ